MSPVIPHPSASPRAARGALGLATVALAAVALLAGAPVARSAAEAPAPPAPLSASAAHHLVVPLSSPDKPVRLEVSVLNGAIDVTGYDGREVVIDAEPLDTHGRHADDDEAPPPPPQAAGMHRIPNGNIGLDVEEHENQVSVDAGPFAGSVALHIRVPVHTALELSLVNGSGITVRGVDGELELDSTNGNITATNVGGSVVAETVNGEVKVALDRVTVGKPLAFTSFNGSIDVTLPAGFKADVRLKTQNGEVWSDFDVDVRGTEAKQETVNGRHRISVEREVRGSVGGGGPELRLETFNGSIFLRKK